MRIGIDYTAAIWQGAGIGRYTRELVRAILEEGGDFRYTLFYAAGGLERASPYLADLDQLRAAHPNVRAAPIPLSPRRLTQLWQRLRLPLPVELFTGPLDLLHAPDFVLPPTRARTLLTIHDLSFLVHPECAVPSMVRYLSDAVPRSVRRADAVLADSQATRQDLARLLSYDPARVTVVYPGVSPRFRPLPPEATASVSARLGLPEHFVLFVSTLEPRKNLVRLIEAFARAADGGWGMGVSASPTPIPHPPSPDLHLVLAGRRGWLYEEIFATIERLGLSERVRLLGFVDDNDLPALYNLAWAFAYPSIYEGFGFPALEALACGVPVVTADNSSLPEVVGDPLSSPGEPAAVLVPAEDVAALAAALGRVVSDTALRARLREAGLARAQHFTWQRAAQQVLECYRQQLGTRD
ncbi:MAG TPA: glycosyltransferase family 1 protein [Roseiflexaceae bacterium]|nr:glycosyltransferase family 1 protein [Roseiflexaceae bacterium]